MVCAFVVLQLYWCFGVLQAFTGISLTVDTHLCMAILIFHAMQFNHFNDGQIVHGLIGIRCEASGASEAVLAVAKASEASEATCA